MSEIIRPVIALGAKNKELSVSISELFHENTKLHPLSGSPMGLVPQKSFSLAETQAITRGYKQYPSFPRVKLPRVESLPRNEIPFDQVVASRRSVRNFADSQMQLSELSKIIWQSYGITGKTTLSTGEIQYLRASPSGGALYPAEIYLGIRMVTGIEPGIYHYNVLNHELELMTPGDPSDSLYNISCQQEYARQASVVILISGVLQRTKRKYGERGYRYVLLDVGHLGQNIYLACTALGLQVMTTCGFFDDEANRFLRLDGVDETVLYVAFVGQS